MREKLTASVLFKEKKVSYPKSVSHPFRGDYVRLRQNLKWKRTASESGDDYVVFADIVNKVSRSSGKVCGNTAWQPTRSLIINAFFLLPYCDDDDDDLTVCAETLGNQYVVHDCPWSANSAGQVQNTHTGHHEVVLESLLGWHGVCSCNSCKFSCWHVFYVKLLLLQCIIHKKGK